MRLSSQLLALIMAENGHDLRRMTAILVLLRHYVPDGLFAAGSFDGFLAVIWLRMRSITLKKHWVLGEPFLIILLRVVGPQRKKVMPTPQ